MRNVVGISRRFGKPSEIPSDSVSDGIRRHIGSAHSLLRLAGKSVELDFRLFQIKPLRLRRRAKFVAWKYIGLARILSGGSVTMKLSPVAFIAADASALGTLQSNISDLYRLVAATNLLTTQEPVVLDVGANVGQFSNAMKLFYPQATITAFEPDPDVFKVLQSNTRHLRGVTLHNVGLGDCSGRQDFYVNELSVLSSFQRPDRLSGQLATKALPVKRLDEIDTGQGMIDLLKIDVEGFEFNILAGATRTLRRVCWLIVELSLGREPSTETNLRLLRFLNEHCPHARIVKFGRPLGDPTLPACQDVLVRLN